MLMMMIALASAGEVDAWGVSDFGHDEQIAGSGGWTNGYRDDPWWSWDGLALSLTDDRVRNDFEGYGTGSEADNWVIRGADIAQGVVRVQWGSQDDDAIGLVSNHNGGDSFYLLIYSEHSVPPPLSETNDRPELILYRVENGKGEVLKRVRSGYAQESNDLSLEVDDGILTASLNGDSFFAVEDAQPLAAGKGGFYAYNSGDDGGNSSSYCWISAIEVAYVDEDDDGVPDDTDNCEDVANPGQADWNDNGIGDACGDPEPQDTGEPGNTDSGQIDTGPGDTDVPPGLTGNIELEAMSCGCASQPSKGRTGIGFGAMAMLLGLTIRRRR
jgi:MYXO-CTERM domain-containing protein